MSGRLIESLATTPAMAELFSDESVLRAMLDFEAALARAEAGCGVIPKKSADAITAAAQPANFDANALADAAFRAGTPAIPLVKALTEKVRAIDAAAAGFVHWGATTQDVVDTAMSLLLRRGEKILSSDLKRLEQSLHHISERHRGSVMLGRTLLQAAPPVTFGLKVAGWLAAIRRSRKNFQGALNAAAVLQFGGASGTLASLGVRGMEVAQSLNRELGFASSPVAPWHTQRDRMATLVCACGVLTGSLGKMARDISLLMQNEVAEAAEPASPGRGGSSTMPNKRNPTACSLTLAAAHRAPGLVASYLSAMVQEHERGLGGWQAEWLIIASVVQATGVAAASMAEVAEGLAADASLVDEKKMRANLANTNGTIFAERAMILLGAKLGRDVAHKIMEAASRSVIGDQSLSAVLAKMPEVPAHLTPADLADLENPESYLGSAEVFRKALLADSLAEDSQHNDSQPNDPRPSDSRQAPEK